MAVPTGTATPWRELPDEVGAGVETAVYIRDGHASGSADLLAEALRADGVVRTLGRAIPVAEAAELELGWYGRLDDGEGDEVLCGVGGETWEGEVVDQVKPCVIATMNVREE